MLKRTPAAAVRRPLTCSSHAAAGAIMVLRMLGSAAAVIGHGGSSRALLASRATTTNTTNTTGTTTIGSSRSFAASRGVPSALSAFVRAPLARTDRRLCIGRTTTSSPSAVGRAERRPGSTWAATTPVAARVCVGASSHAGHYRQHQQQQQ
ncbi:unnamed protein product, partial [Laminaria digitata]